MNGFNNNHPQTLSYNENLNGVWYLVSKQMKIQKIYQQKKNQRQSIVKDCHLIGQKLVFNLVTCENKTLNICNMNWWQYECRQPWL